jgi:hypothetical protein
MMGGWIPPAEVTTHTGEPVPTDLRFFAEPPREIGTVRSAWSTLRVGQRPNRLPAMVIGALITGVLAAAIVIMLGGRQTSDTVNWGAVGTWAIPSAVVGLLLGYVAAPKPTCTFVGTDGIAKFSWNGEQQAPAAEIHLFSTATELRNSMVHNYHNGIYTGTNYEFWWTDAAGKRLFQIKGEYRGRKQGPKPGHEFYYGSAAESAWTEYLLPRAQEEWKRGNPVTFPINARDYVRLGQGYLEFGMKGKVDRCEIDEIGSFSINQGQVTLKRRGAKSGFFGLGASGVYSFPYQNLANAKLFLRLLQMVATEEDAVPA